MTHGRKAAPTEMIIVPKPKKTVGAAFSLDGRP
jgi:hypothetical protein